MAGQRQRAALLAPKRGKDAGMDLAAGLVQMMEEADLLIAVTDLEGYVVAWNRALAALTGCPGSEGLGKKLSEWLTGLGVRDLADIMGQVADRREPLRCEVRLPGISGGISAAAFNVIPVRGPDGAPVAVMAAGHDLTALRALQSQVLHAEKLATVGQITAGVAHEINNPLTSIQMCVEAVLRKGDLALQGRIPNLFEPTDLDRLKRIQEGAERIRKFSRELTMYARPSGRDIEDVNLNEVVEHALSFCEHVLYEAKASLTRELSPDLPRMRVVRDHIMQVVTNLVSNAAQALGDEGGSIVVRTFNDGATHVGLSVSDNGEGIREEDRPRMFEPFFTTKPAGRGTGLGLPVVRNIVLAHGGQITFESKLGSGTTFKVSLPLSTGSMGSVNKFGNLDKLESIVPSR
jgi:two-component system, NtrC family, sensor kinase